MPAWLEPLLTTTTGVWSIFVVVLVLTAVVTWHVCSYHFKLKDTSSDLREHLDACNESSLKVQTDIKELREHVDEEIANLRTENEEGRRNIHNRINELADDVGEVKADVAFIRGKLEKE